MARHTTKIAARIPDEAADALDQVCEREGLKNRSEALRVCIEHYVAAKNQQWHTDTLVLNIPNALLDMLDRCVSNGLATNRGEAVNIALHQWVNSNLALYARGDLERLERKLAEISGEVRRRKLAEREGKGLVR
jgi:metal-responsive CopG/Arc/MetJ family transcriptional regulator